MNTSFRTQTMLQKIMFQRDSSLLTTQNFIVPHNTLLTKTDNTFQIECHGFSGKARRYQKRDIKIELTATVRGKTGSNI